MTKVVVFLCMMLLGIGLLQAFDEGPTAADKRSDVLRNFDVICRFKSNQYPCLKTYFTKKQGMECKEGLDEMNRAFIKLNYARKTGDISDENIKTFLSHLEDATKSHMKRNTPVTKFTVNQVAGASVGDKLVASNL